MRHAATILAPPAYRAVRHIGAPLARLLAASLLAASGCIRAAPLEPSQAIDLGTVVTDDLPQRFWGTGFLKAMNFTKQNSTEIVRWAFPAEGDSLRGSNSYYTLFNHGGPHVDAPNHVRAGGGIDSYQLQSFVGPAKVFDASAYAPGRSVPVELFRGRVRPGDVVLVWTRYRAPNGDAMPEVKALTHAAAEYLATLPVRAFGTDAFSVDALSEAKRPLVHHSFLARGIPAYEQLQNLDKLLGKGRLFFVGVPLNIKDGDGMMVRPVVFVQ